MAAQKKLEAGSKYANFDKDGDGIVTDEEFEMEETNTFKEELNEETAMTEETQMEEVKEEEIKEEEIKEESVSQENRSETRGRLRRGRGQESVGDQEHHRLCREREFLRGPR